MEISEEVTLHITTEAVEQEEIPVVASKKDAQLCPIDSLDSARDDNTDNNKGYDVRVDHQSSFSSLRQVTTVSKYCFRLKKIVCLLIKSHFTPPFLSERPSNTAAILIQWACTNIYR